jgi:uncharacterized protein YjaG (DUF416 family)
LNLTLQRFFGFILIQAVIIKLMTTSQPIQGNFTSDFSKDSEADADDKIVIDKLLVNKLTELLINSIYSVHVSRSSEIFLTSLDMHLAENSISNKNNKASHDLLKNLHGCWNLTKRLFLNCWERQRAVWKKRLT